MRPLRVAHRWIALALLVAAGGCNAIFGVMAGDSTSSGATGSGGAGGPGAGGGGHTITVGTTGTTATSGTSTATSSSTGSGSNVVITPLATTLLAQTTLTFTTNVPAADIDWTVVEPDGGSVTASGAYTAPLADGTFHLRATRKSTLQHTDATIYVKQSAAPQVIVSTGALATATGHGSQTHIAYAEATKRWWLFHDPSDTSQLATRYSSDFTTWRTGEHVALSPGHSGDGRDLSIAYRNIGGHDIIHITQGSLDGTTLGRYHIRASVTADHIAFGTPLAVNSGGDNPPDGASTVILPSGIVIDTTGVEPTPQTPPLSPCGNGDVDTYTSVVADDGVASFDGVAFGQQVLWCVGDHVNARQLLAVGGTAVQLYEDGEGGPPVNILMNVRTAGGSWTPLESTTRVKPPTVFTTDQMFELNDWTATVSGTTVHAVRRLGNAFEHRMMSTLGVWLPGGAIPDEATVANSGLFLAPYGDGLVLVALSAVSGNAIRYTAFDGSGWSAWATLSSTPASRNDLAGYAPTSGAKPAVIWTETAGSSFAISGALLP